MNVLLAPIAVVGLSACLALRQARQNASNSPSSNFSSQQAPAALLESPDVRSQASSMLKPALQSA
jgi:hypothetical protein